MITSTTISSISVKPWRRRRKAAGLIRGNAREGAKRSIIIGHGCALDHPRDLVWRGRRWHGVDAASARPAGAGAAADRGRGGGAAFGRRRTAARNAAAGGGQAAATGREPVQAD